MVHISKVQNTGYIGTSGPRFGLAQPAKLTWEKLPSIHDPSLGEIEHYRFSNGTEFYGLHRQDVPLVSFGESIKTGALNENDRTDGVSHFLEHLLFKGTTTMKPGEFDKKVGDLGAGANAYTSHDNTFYYLYHIPKEALKIAIPFHAERLQNALIPSTELLKERFVVVEEINRANNNKIRQLTRQLYGNLWPSHNYSRTILGPAENIGDHLREVLDAKATPEETAAWKKILESMGKPEEQSLSKADQKKAARLKAIFDKRGLTPQNLLALHPFNASAKPLSEQEIRTQVKVNDLSREEILGYYAKYYGPENRSIIAVGDYDKKEVLDLIAEHYNRPFPPKGGEPAGEERTFINPAAPSKTASAGAGASNAVMEEDVQFAMVAKGYPAPGSKDVSHQKQRLALEMLAGILGVGKSSRLYQQLVEKEKIVTSVSCGLEPRKDQSVFTMSAQSKAEDLDKVKTRFKEAIDEVIKSGITPEELNKAKIGLKQELASISESQFVTIQNLAYFIAQGDLSRELGSSLKLINDITPKDIQEAAKTYLAEDKAKTVSMVPKKSAPAQNGAPKFAGYVRFAGTLSPQDKTTTLSNGAELIVRERPKALNTSITIRIKGGDSADSIPGLMSMLAATFQRGTEAMPASKLQERLESKGLSLSMISGPDSFTINMSGLSESKDEMVAILKDLLKAPAFKADDLEFMKKRLRDKDLSKSDTNPTGVARDLLDEAMFPEGHPYGLTDKRMIAQLDKITPAQLKEAYLKLFNPQQLKISAVGGFTLDEAKSALNDVIPAQANASETTAKPAALTIAQNKIVTKSKDDLAQAEIYRGWSAPGLNDPDRIAMFVMNNILSGGMSARLFKTFREGDKGLCYSTSASYTPDMQSGAFRFYIGTDPANTRLVLDLFQNEVKKLIETKPTDEEMNRVKLSLKSSIMAVSQSSASVSNILAMHRLFDLMSPEEVVAAIEKITPEQVQAVAQKYLTRPSITAVYAPKAALESHKLPVDGESIIATPAA